MKNKIIQMKNKQSNKVMERDNTNVGINSYSRRSRLSDFMRSRELLIGPMGWPMEDLAPRILRINALSSKNDIRHLSQLILLFLKFSGNCLGDVASADELGDGSVNSLLLLLDLHRHFE